MNRSLPKLLPVAAIAMLVLAACTSSSTAPSGSLAASATTPPYPTGPVTIELWTKEGDPQIGRASCRERVLTDV